MLRLPEGVTLERSERDGRMRVRCRILVEGMQEEPTNVSRHFSFDSPRDRMELDVLTKVCEELDRLRLAIKASLDAE